MDFNEMTDQGLADLIEQARDVLATRQSRAAVDRQVADVLRTARAEGVTETPAVGAEWVQPVGAHDAYLAGDVVEHDGKTWVALINCAVHAPGVAGWREQTADGAPAEYVQPSGSADAYQPGDLITFEGETYRCVLENCVWSPADHPPAWKKEK